MSQSATDRYQLRAAPGGVALVQELANTRPNATHGLPDLLATREHGQPWATQAAQTWAGDNDIAPPDLTNLSSADLRALRDLRATFDDLVTGATQPGRHVSTPATLVTGHDGLVRLVPVGTGVRWLVSALWIAALTAQQDGTWPRLKLCRNTACSSAFYDLSRNNSGVWHNVHTCGNVANLRASRERKRARATQEPHQP